MKHITQAWFAGHKASQIDKSSAIKLILLGSIIISLLILGYGKISGNTSQTQARIDVVDVTNLTSEVESYFEVTQGFSIDSFIAMLGDPSPMSRWQTAYALAESADSRAVEPLITLIDDIEPDVRYRVVRALGNFKDPRVIDPLLYCLSAADQVIRREAIRSLGKVGDGRAARMLCVLTLDVMSRYVQRR